MNGQLGLPVPFPVVRQDRIPVQRYFDPEFHELENELLWSRVWQMACRLEEIPETGDFVEYENVGRSIILLRVSDSEVKAYYNACRHRGVKLVEDRGTLRSGFTCPFHGWCYGLDGANTFLYQPDLFAEDNRTAEDVGLRECRVELWGGCAFINFDDNAPPLRECIEPFATTLDAWHAETLRTEWWLSFRLPVNWKLAMEAFMEGYHVMQTHPQLLPPNARGKGSVYNASGKSYKEGTRPTKEAQAAATVGMNSEEFIENQLHYLRVYNDGLRGLFHQKDVWVAEKLRGMELPDDPQLRYTVWRQKLNEAIVEWNESAGMDIPDLNGLAEQGVTGGVMFCFPHFFLLPGLSSAESYRIRPLGPEECLFEIWSLTRYPKDEQPPRPQRPVPMAGDDPGTPPIPAQDFSNLPRQQLGLHSGGIEYMRLSDKIEGLISNYQRLVDGYLAGVEYERLVPVHDLVNGPIDTPCKDIHF
jgi:phenylpropionate dioxygenase-like ring-hydroxylating dioxygenase large terminal subunit